MGGGIFLGEYRDFKQYVQENYYITSERLNGAIYSMNV